MRTIIVGTRQSPLALQQTGQVIEQLHAICSTHGIDCDFQVKKIVTKGDRILDVTLSKAGGKGLFVKEIEQALLEAEIDIAVHSLKDMPAELPPGLVIGAVSKREDARDCLISGQFRSFRDLPHGATVGTSSLRRSCQLKAHRPDLVIRSIRGNINSRLNKLESEGLDAIVLAAAGLHRMGWGDRISEYLPVDLCLPAVGQGALAVECRAGDQFVLDLLQRYRHVPTELAVTAERNFLARLGGNCQVPVAAYAELAATGDGGVPVITLKGMVGSADGGTILSDTMQGADPAELGMKLAERLISRGADKLLEPSRGES